MTHPWKAVVEDVISVPPQANSASHVDMLIKTPDVQFPKVSIVDGSAHPVFVNVRFWSGLRLCPGKISLPMDPPSATKFGWIQKAIWLQMFAGLVAIFLWAYCGLMLVGVLPRSGSMGGWVIALAAGTALVGLPSLFVPPQYPRRTSDGDFLLRRVDRRMAFDCQRMNEEGLIRVLE